MFGQLICKNFKLRVERFHIKGFKDEYNEIGFDLKFIFTIQKNILTPLTLSRGGGKNTCAAYFGNISSMEARIFMKFGGYVHKILLDHQPNFHKDPFKDVRA